MTDRRKLAYQRVDFEDPDQPGSGRGLLEVSVPSGRNQGKYSFKVGDVPIIEVRTTHPITSTWSSAGKLVAAGVDVVEVEDYIPVIYEKEFRLRYVPVGAVAVTWMGDGYSKHSQDGQILRLSSSVLGYMKVVYSTEVLLYRLQDVQKSGKVLAVFVNEVTDGNTEIEFETESGGTAESSKREAYAIIQDIKTRQPVAGVKVYVAGQYKGETDGNGRVYLGEMAKGTYQWRLVPPSPYYASDEDGIANDRFTLT